MGLPGSGKTTFVNECLTNGYYSFEKYSGLIDFYYKKKFYERFINVIVNNLFNKKEYDISFHKRLSLLTINFSNYFPNEYLKAVDFLYIFLDNGFKPNSLWLQKYFENWLFVAIAKDKKCQFINDEGVSQRLLAVLSQTKIPKSIIVSYFQDIDQIWYMPTNLDLSTKRLKKRERDKGLSIEELENFTSMYEDPINYVLSIEELQNKIIKLENLEPSRFQCKGN